MAEETQNIQIQNDEDNELLIIIDNTPLDVDTPKHLFIPLILTFPISVALMAFHWTAGALTNCCNGLPTGKGLTLVARSELNDIY